MGVFVDFMTDALDGLRGRAEVQIPLARPEKPVAHLPELVADEVEHGMLRVKVKGGSRRRDRKIRLCNPLFNSLILLKVQRKMTCNPGMVHLPSDTAQVR